MIRVLEILAEFADAHAGVTGQRFHRQEWIENSAYYDLIGEHAADLSD